MSQFPPDIFGQPAPKTGLAIAALIFGIAGFFIPLAGVIGLILGIVAMRRAKREPQIYGGSGMGLAAIITGSFGTLILCVFLGLLGLLLPTLGHARQTAQHEVSLAHLRQIGMGLHQYAAANRSTMPEQGADLVSRLGPYTIPRIVFQSPRNRSAPTTESYIYIPGFNLTTAKSPSTAILMYENPEHILGLHKRVPVLYLDGHVESVSIDELPKLLDDAEKPQAPTSEPTAKPGR